MQYIRERWYKDKNKYEESKFKLLKLFLFNLIISYYESNFLFISSSVFLQIFNPSFSSILNIFSLVAVPIYLNHFLYFTHSLNKKINIRRFAFNYKNTVDKFSILIEDIKYNLHGFDRFNYKRRPNRKE